MTNFQPLLQRALTALDPWLDAVFPVATALICAKQRLAGNSLLVIYLALRMLQRSDQEPWRLIMMCLLAANAGLIIEDRDLKPGSPSDYLIIALSFTAGFQRSQQEWKNSIPWIASCSVPLFIMSISAGEDLIDGQSSFTGFNINKLGFLAGLVTVASYGWLRQAKTKTARALAITTAGISITEAILTQSRAAIAAPMIAIAVEFISSRRWTPQQFVAAGAVALAITANTTYTWYLKKHASYDLAKDHALGELNRAKNIQCWFSSTIQTHRGALLGLGYGRRVQDFCGPEAIPTLTKMNKSKGLQHAHNFYAQIFTESGISGLIISVLGTVSAFRKALSKDLRRNLPFALTLVIYLALTALVLTFWQVMMINQVLVGYSLAALTAKVSDRAAAGAAIRSTQPT